MKKLKKATAMLSAAVITMTGAAFAEMSAVTENVFIAESVCAEESKTTEFFNSNSADENMIDICDGSLSDKTFQMAGRTYTQGMIFAVNNKDTYVTFNIKNKNIENISFDFGHTEDISKVTGKETESECKSSVLTVEVDGYSEKIITLDPEDGIYRFNSAEHDLRDLSTASEITFRLDSTSSHYAYSYYAFANISVNEEAAPGYTHPQYNIPEEFINSSFYTEGVTAHDGKVGTKDYFMKGREYYQGLKFDRQGFACFNVEALNTVEFTMGQIDNGNHSTMKLTIMLDGEIYDKFDEYEVSWKDMLETVSIDVSNATTLYISRDDNSYDQFIALGDITIDGKTPEEESETKNYANAGEFVASAFNTYNYIYSEEIMISGEEHIGFIPNSYNSDGSICFNVENIGTVSFIVAPYDNRDEENTLRVSLDGVEAPNGKITLTPGMSLSESIVVDTSKSSILYLETDEIYAEYCIVDFEISKDAPTGDNVISPDAVVNTPEDTNGDANNDGKINVRDCAAIASALATGTVNELSEFSDYNKDGKINVRDAAALAADLAKGTLKQ